MLVRTCIYQEGWLCFVSQGRRCMFVKTAPRSFCEERWKKKRYRERRKIPNQETGGPVCSTGSHYAFPKAHRAPVPFPSHPIPSHPIPSHRHTMIPPVGYYPQTKRLLRLAMPCPVTYYSLPLTHTHTHVRVWPQLTACDSSSGCAAGSRPRPPRPSPRGWCRCCSRCRRPAAAARPAPGPGLV